MTNRLLEKLNSEYSLKRVDIQDMATLKANGMTFTIEAYKAEKLGHVSVMRAKGFFGLMKMDTVIINPYFVDLPLYSYDRIFAMSNDTLIVELYDTLENEYCEKHLEDVKGEYTYLSERDPGKHWYDDIKLKSSISKKGKKEQTPKFDELSLRHFEAYLSTRREVNDITKKKEKAEYYVNGLLQNGGPSTDVFKKALGLEKTTQLFKKVLFGIE